MKRGAGTGELFAMRDDAANFRESSARSSNSLRVTLNGSRARHFATREVDVQIARAISFWLPRCPTAARNGCPPSAPAQDVPQLAPQVREPHLRARSSWRQSWKFSA